MNANSTLLGISLVESIVLEKPDETQAIASLLTKADAAELIPFLSTTVAVMLLEQHGLTGAVERLDYWRKSALAASDA